MTATPKETEYVSNIDYFGEPIYTYSLKQGIDDGFLAPYKVVRMNIDKDLEGYRPTKNKVDKYGIVHTSIGKISFEADKIVDNAKEFLNTIKKLKPTSSKGTYIKSVTLSTTMSPGVRIDPSDLRKAV